MSKQPDAEELYNDFAKNFDTAESQAALIKAGRPPLHEAMELQDEFLDRILKLSNLDLTVRAKNGQTALHRAVEIHAFSSAEKLLAHEDGNKIINAQDKDGNTPLHILVTRTILGKSIEEQKKLISLMIAQGADLNAQNRNGETPLTEAIKYGDKAIVLHMIQEYSTKGLMDKGKQTEIYKLAKKNRHDYDLEEIASTMGYIPPVQPKKEVVAEAPAKAPIRTDPAVIVEGTKPKAAKKAVTQSPAPTPEHLKAQFIEKLKSEYEQSDPQLFTKLQSYINNSKISQTNGNVTITLKSAVTSNKFAKMISGMRSTDEEMVKQIAKEFQDFVKDPKNKTTISLPSRYSSKRRQIQI